VLNECRANWEKKLRTTEIDKKKGSNSSMERWETGRTARKKKEGKSNGGEGTKEEFASLWLGNVMDGATDSRIGGTAFGQTRVRTTKGCETLPTRRKESAQAAETELGKRKRVVRKWKKFGGPSDPSDSDLPTKRK